MHPFTDPVTFQRRQLLIAGSKCNSIQEPVTDQQQQRVELPIGGIANGHLTTGVYSSVFATLLRNLPQIRSAGQVQVNLDALKWIDHLPLLSLALIVKQCAKLLPNHCEVLLPASPQREAFLERWGFFELLDEQQIYYEISEDVESYEESEHSRVLPVTSFANMKGAAAPRDLMLKAEGNLQEVLRKHACLEDSDVSALADLVVFELCKNVIEHSKNEIGGCIIAHTSMPTAKMAEVRNRTAATWEKDFYARIGEEGVTEVVIGDSGVGIIESLREQAKNSGASSAKDILQHAFDPYSTSKKERERKTRGLWCVRQKIRDLGGLLYVRSCSNNLNHQAFLHIGAEPPKQIPVPGVAAYWDFLNNPDQEEPRFVEDQSWFPGTQYQIIIPQRNHDRPRTYIALHIVEGFSSRTKAKAAAIRAKPSGASANNALCEEIRNLRTDEVLFVDMSSMEIAWNREEIDGVLKVICGELVRDRKRRVWLLKPNQRTLELMRFSSDLIALWKEQAIMVPVVNLKDDLSLPPDVFPVLSDPGMRTKDHGDTKEARQRLVNVIWLAVGDSPQPVKPMLDGLSRQERSWLEDSIQRNFAIAHTVRRQGKTLLVPEFGIHDLARTAGMMLLKSELGQRIKKQLEQQQKLGLCWYRLTSGLFCREYINDRIWHDIDPWLRNRIDCWIEEKVAALAPRYVVSYTEFGNALLARALESRREATPLNLGNYLDLHGPNGLSKLEIVNKNDLVVILLDISGSGKTVEALLNKIEERGATAHLVCLIDTISVNDRNRRPLLDALYRTKRVQSLVCHSIEKIDALPKAGTGASWPIANIDPVSLLPIPQVRVSETLMADGEFWWHVARTGTLSTTNVNYKGHEFSCFIWLTGLFKDRDCASKVADHLNTCIDGSPPEVVIITAETGDFIAKGPGLWNLLSVKYQSQLFLEGQDNLPNEFDLQNKKVAIFSGATTSGTGIARLLKRCGLASRVHICVFVDRMSNDISSTFVQKKGVSFSTFQRLFTDSPLLHHRNYRATALKALAQYRRSCLSNRMLLYVDEQIAHHHQSHTFVESSSELSENSDILISAVETKCLPLTATYNLTSKAGYESLLVLVQQWASADDLTLPKAILEEACCRYECSTDEGFNSEQYLCAMLDNYDAARESPNADKMRELILSIMLLERLPGERFGHTPLAARLDTLLWTDFVDAVQRDAYKLATVCLRSYAKVYPSRFLDRLSEIIPYCVRSRSVELSLALELSKLSYDPRFSVSIFGALEQAIIKLATRSNYFSAVNIATQDLLRDLGLLDTGANVQLMAWGEIVTLLASQPPDTSRTVRAAIRAIHQLNPNLHIGYFKKIGGQRFLLVDSWPPPRHGTGQSFPVSSEFVHRLLGQNDRFFTADLAAEDAVVAKELYQRMTLQRQQPGLVSWSIFIAEISAGRGSSPVAPHKFGFLRVQAMFSRKESPGISNDQHEHIKQIANDVCNLLGRAEATHVAKLGAWQFEHAVGGLGKVSNPAQEEGHTLQKLADLMVDLLSADICRVAVHDSDEHKWKSKFVSGKWWANSTLEIDIDDNDKHSLTVKVASLGSPKRVEDVQVGDQAQPPNRWVRGCVALPLVRAGSKCEVVVTLWHHVKDWFSQFNDVLLETLSAIGGARLYALESQEAQKSLEEGYFIKSVAAHISHTLGNRLDENEFVTLAERVPEEFKEHAIRCLHQVRQVHKMQVRFALLARMDEFMADGRYKAEFLLKELQPVLLQSASASRLSVRACELVRFEGRIVCNIESLLDDIIELVHNSARHGEMQQKHLLEKMEISLGLRPASPDDLAQSKELRTAEPERQYAVLEFSDTGVGIPKDMKESIFKRKAFRQAAGSKRKSMGLGMPLARSLARKLGGDLVECGQPGKGARFLMFLPRNS